MTSAPPVRNYPRPSFIKMRYRYAYRNIRNKEHNDTHIFVTYILNTLRRFTVCYCCEK